MFLLVRGPAARLAFPSLGAYNFGEDYPWREHRNDLSLSPF